MNAPASLYRTPESMRYGQEAEKELGLGLPPSQCGMDPNVLLGMKCDPRGPQKAVESADWSLNGALADADILKTFAQRINVWGTTDGVAPAGVADASNTCNTPGTFAEHTVITAIRFRFEVQNFGGTIEGGFLPAGLTASQMPGVPDVWAQTDTANALSLASGQVLLPAELLVNIPAWLAFEALINAYYVKVKINEENLIMYRRLRSVKAAVKPFGEAEGMGQAFMPVQNLISDMNQRLSDLGQPGQFVKRTHERLGVLANGGTPIGDFTVASEGDSITTVFGGSGGEGKPFDDGPDCAHVFAKPMLWIAGRPLGIEYEARSAFWQAIMQQWLSITGGVNGVAGTALNMPQSPINAALSGLAPTNTGANFMVEQALDTPTTFVSQQRQTNQTILRSFHARLGIDVCGFRVKEPWFPYVVNLVQQGGIYAPFGCNELK